ncbi:MAG: prepilin-type N-terminal cleavage/methylation domain-containing protein [Gammaproteobacteria bacterium]|nr:prepilin-type N-terminal cleavage/methylation domain-containing protein [Gammaproteobacteria bacterium]
MRLPSSNHAVLLPITGQTFYGRQNYRYVIAHPSMVICPVCFKNKIAGTLGFTLIELAIAIAIVGLLSAIALPVYMQHIDKSNNNKAIADIMMIQVAIERFHTANFRFPADINEIPGPLPNNGLDPWKNPYVYLNIVDGGPDIKGDVRKDKKLNPINTQYDLYSMGKNGVSKNQLDQKDSVDDIVLARDGGFVGLSSDF